MRNSSPSAPDRSPHPYDSGRSNPLGWRAELNDLKKHYLLEEHQNVVPRTLGVSEHLLQVSD
jgi:hypothetical protein